MKYYNRNSEDQLEKLIAEARVFSNVVLIEGARQTGKTTLIRYVIRNHKNLEINLETNVTLRDQIDQTSSFEQFKIALKTYFDSEGINPDLVFIDEAQESSKLGRYVRNLKEEWPDKQFLLSGSSMKRLFRPKVRIPVGRILRFKVDPLRYQEFLRFSGQDTILEALDNFTINKKIDSLLHQKALEQLDQFLICGGLPEVVLSKKQGLDFERVKKSILINQKDDFIRKEDFEQKYLIDDALVGIANHLGYPSATTHICDSYKEAKKILSVLLDWHLIHQIAQKGLSSTSKHYPKRYIYDIGISNELRSLPLPSLSTLETIVPDLRTQLGGILENLVLLELLGLSSKDIVGWKKDRADSSEVDFVIDFEGQTIPFEVKSHLKTSKRSYKALKAYLEVSKLKLGILTSPAPFLIYQYDNKTIVNLPIYLLQRKVLRYLVDQYG